MNWFWLDVGEDGGRAVCEELGVTVVVLVEDGASVAFLRLGDALLGVVEDRDRWLN